MIAVVLVRSPKPRTVEERSLQLPDGSTLAYALDQAGWNTASGNAQAPRWSSSGIWGRKAAPDTVLRDGDRVELYRELRVDPKVARRERFVGQGSRSAGLFAQRRPNSKAGY